MDSAPPPSTPDPVPTPADAAPSAGPDPTAPGTDVPPLPRSLRGGDSPRSQWARRSVTLKLFAIAVITLVLLVPLMLLHSLINERELLRDNARSELSGKWGGPQRVGGPVLTIPITRPALTAAQAQALTSADRDIALGLHILPNDLEITGTIEPEVRRRGIHEVVLYTTRLRIKGTFPTPAAGSLNVGVGTADLTRAYVEIGIPDMQGLKEGVTVTWNGVPLEAGPGIPTTEMFTGGLSVPVMISADSVQRFETEIVLGGAQRLTFLPLGKETRVNLTSSWTSPSAIGSFLSDSLSITPQGFTGRWKVLHLNRNYGQRFVGDFPGGTGGNEGAEYNSRYSVETAPSADGAFGVELLQGVDGYRKTMRSAEYGLLFVLLTFATFFFIEVLGGRRVHPVQYLLVGMAVCLFYLMLLAFSEYVVFDVAYIGAALAILALVLLYAKSIFDSWRLAGLVAGVLAAFYLYFYVLLSLEDLALLVGSVGLFVILAGVMYLSRRVDWYGMTGKAEG